MLNFQHGFNQLVIVFVSYCMTKVKRDIVSQLAFKQMEPETSITKAAIFSVMVPYMQFLGETQFKIAMTSFQTEEKVIYLQQPSQMYQQDHLECQRQALKLPSCQKSM
ncbi:hypothetical protein ABPG72_013807 [Tetrahymena utriculariae]